MRLLVSCSGVALPIAGISLSITNFGMDVFSSQVRARRKTCDSLRKATIGENEKER